MRFFAASCADSMRRCAARTAVAAEPRGRRRAAGDGGSSARGDGAANADGSSTGGSKADSASAAGSKADSASTGGSKADGSSAASGNGSHAEWSAASGTSSAAGFGAAQGAHCCGAMSGGGGGGDASRGAATGVGGGASAAASGAAAFSFSDAARRASLFCLMSSRFRSCFITLEKAVLLASQPGRRSPSRKRCPAVMFAMRSSARRCAIVWAASGAGGGAGAARTPDGATKTDAPAGFTRAKTRLVLLLQAGQST